jgi:predicted homoserine dehydrogenase-like protein
VASVNAGALPIGLAHRLKLVKPVTRGSVLTYADVEAPAQGPAMALRRETEGLAEA